MNTLLWMSTVASLISVISTLTLEEREQAVWASSPHENDTSVRPFTIQFTDEMLSDLIKRLKRPKRVTPPMEGVAYEYAFNTKTLDYWINYWINEYNFTKQEAFFNKYPHYKTNIQGLDIHFMHIKPETTDCVIRPLLILHGFPGAFREFYDSIPLLTTCTNGIALELVIPSLPGFGFSDAATRPGLGGTEMGTVFKLLMNRLGFDEFYVQAGDWGSIISSMMATLYPKVIRGYHTNFPLSLSPTTLATWFAASSDPSLVVDPALQDRMYPFLDIIKSRIYATGYLHMQATKPDTLGVALSDSPAGLLGNLAPLWTIGTVSGAASMVNGGLDLYPVEQVIDLLMIYWMNNCFTTAARLYAEGFNVRNVREGLYAEPTPVPTWSVHAKNEMVYQSPTLLKLKYTNLINSTVLDDYGHFLALQAPEVYSDNVLTAIAAFEDWHQSNTRDEL